MLKTLIKFRYLFVVAGIITLLNALVILSIGVYKAVEGYIAAFEMVSHHTTERPGIMIVESLDLFLISFVFMTFGLGIINITLNKTEKTNDLNEMLSLKQFRELKLLLWETILITLVVFCLTQIVKHEMNLTWIDMAIPGVVFILSVSYWFVKKSH